MRLTQGGLLAGSVERDLEEKPQASDRGIERARRSAVIDQMQLVTSKVLDGDMRMRQLSPKTQANYLHVALHRSGRQPAAHAHAVSGEHPRYRANSRTS
jgi:hypothetical protein